MIVVLSGPQKLAGEITVPGDKSITHRALILGALARGTTQIEGFLEAGDARSTIGSLKALGVKISEEPGLLIVEGRDMKLQKPGAVLDAGNSGTTLRLLLGVLASLPFETLVTGDASLKKRPMRRVTRPLGLMGATFPAGADSVPLAIKGGPLKAISYTSNTPSAQVKSAVLLAALSAEGETVFKEPLVSRNHTELMLKEFGAEIGWQGSQVWLKGGHPLQGGRVRVPGDISSAAFFMVAAALVPGAAVLLKEVGLNPTRRGVVDVLLDMGADLKITNKKMWGKEEVADIFVKGGRRLKAVTIGESLIPRLIDEIPVLSVAAAVAEGTTTIEKVGELKVKETDRLAAVTEELSGFGAQVAVKEDNLVITGKANLKGAEVSSRGDHRMAMALTVAGLVAQGDTVIGQAEALAVSYPRFMQDLRSLLAE